MTRAGSSGDWPALSLERARELLTERGAPFEMEELVIRGVAMRTWKNTPPTLAVLAERARAHGDGIFSVYGNERVSFEANYRSIAATAHWLSLHGIGKGDRVALAMRNLPEWPVIFFAATVIGALIVPLNAWWSGQELEHALADCGAQVLFCDAERGERIGPHLAALPALRRVVIARAATIRPAGSDALEDLIGRPADYRHLAAAALPAASLHPDDAAAILYTSGTTGRARGAVATHRNLLTNILSTGYAAARNYLRRGQPLPASAPRVRLISVPLFHVTGCLGLIGGISSGNTNIFMHKWDPLEAMQIIERERVNIAGGVPTIVSQLLDHPERGRFDLSSLELVAYGGAPAPPGLARRIRAELGAMPSTGWGMTETASAVTAVSAEEYLRRPESCGPPVAVAELKVVEPGGTAALPAGELGELWAKGPMVVHGYWNDPAATAATFVDGWVRTGDLGKLDEDGFCTIVDRIKDVIIRGGENIYASEVEGLLQTHPKVVAAALVGLPHRSLGEEPAAVVRLAAGARLSESDLQAWVRERLAAFKTPARVVFVQEDFPRNAGGKIVKTALRALFDE